MGRPVFAVALALLLALAGVAAVAASPASVSVCSACGDSFERAAEAVGESVTVRNSTAVVRVHVNGSTTWTVRNRLSDEEVQGLSENDSLRPALEVALERGVGYTGDDPPTLLSASIERANVTASYRVDGEVRRSAGALLYTGLRDDPAARVYIDLGADRLRVVPPDGYRVGYTPPAATVDDGTVTLTRLPESGTTRFLAFSQHGMLAGVAAHGAVGLTILPTIGATLLLLVALPALAFAGVATVLRPALDRVPALDHRHAATGVGVLSMYIAAHPVVPVPLTSGFEPLAFAAGISGLTLAGGVVVPAVRDRLDTQRAFALTLVALALAILLTYLAFPRPGYGAPDGLGETVVRVAPVTLVLLGFPLGVAAASGCWTRALKGALIGVGATLIVTAPVADRGGSLYVVGVFIAVFAGLLAPLAGAPLALLGFTTARADRP